MNNSGPNKAVSGGLEGKAEIDSMLARVRIRRFDPSTGGDPYYQEFEGIPFEGRSVLEVLHLIYEEHDPSLAFRRLCTRGFCGSCFVVVNGEPALACQYPAKAQMIIEPHPKFPVIRDLVVDLDHPIDDCEELASLPAAANPITKER